MRRFLLLSLLATSCLASAAIAQQTPPAAPAGQSATGQMPMMQHPPMMGGNMQQPSGQPGNMGTQGGITLDEFIKAAPQHFAEMDKNHDGKLTPDEMPPRPGMGMNGGGMGMQGGQMMNGMNGGQMMGMPQGGPMGGPGGMMPGGPMGGQPGQAPAAPMTPPATH